MRDTKDTQNLYTYPQSSVASTMNRYELESSGFETRWRRHFSYPPRPALRLKLPLVRWIERLFLGVKRPGRGVDHPPPPPRVEVMKGYSLPSLPLLCLQYYVTG